MMNFPTPIRRSLCAVPLAALISLPALTAQAQPFEASPSWSSADDQRVGGLAFGDANGDGHLDLAAGTYGGGFPALTMNTLVFIHDGSGLETTPSWISAYEPHTTSVGWGFVTGASTPDLIAINGGSSSHQSVIYPAGPGALASTPTWFSDDPSGTSGIDFALGDVNGDGTPDLFVSNQCFNPCTEIQNLGYLSAGGQLPETPNWQSTDLGQFGGVALADIDGSGVEVQDLSFTATGDSGLFWLPGAPIVAIHRILVDGANPGKVTWDADAGYLLLSSSPPAGATVDVRFARSDDLDLVIGARPGGVLLFAAGAAGPATTASQTLGPTAYDFKDLVFADLDRDGDLDLVAGGSHGSPLAVYDNDQGALATTASWTTTEDDYSADDIVIADFDGNGYPDLASVQFAGDPIVRVHFNHDGALEDSPSFTVPWEGMSTAAVAAGDVDGDGMPELAVGRSGAPTHLYTNTGQPLPAPAIAQVVPTEHSGPEPTTLTISGSDFASPVRVYLGDLELLDVAVASPASVSATVDGATPDGTYDVIVVNADLQAAVAPAAFVMGTGSGTGGGGGAGATGGTGGAGGSALGGAPAATTPDDEEGCDCRAAPGQRAPKLGWLLLAGLAAVLLRRRISSAA